MIDRLDGSSAPDGKLEKLQLNLEPLSNEKLQEISDLSNKIFPNVGLIEESPNVALAASLDPSTYQKQLDDWGISSLNYWVAKDRDNVVGVTGLYTKTEDPEATAWIGRYGIVPEIRGKGIGSKLLQETIDTARTRGVKELRLYTTNKDDPVAHKVFEKFGFNIFKEEIAPEGYSVFNMAIRLDGAAPEKSLTQRLLNRSKYKRENALEPGTVIERNGERYTIEMIDSTDHADFSKMYALFSNTFKADEVDSPETMKKYLEEGSDLIMAALKNEKGEVVASLLGYRFDDTSGNSIAQGKSMFGVDMVATHPDYQKKGLARELYISATMKAERNALAENKQLSLAMGECTYTSERFWNDVGWSRMYAVDSKNKKLTEIKYIQPPVDFDPKTGLAAEGLTSVPEHLMTDSLERRTSPTKEELAAVAQTWVESFSQTREFFESDTAFAANKALIQKYTNDLTQQIQGAERIVLLNQRARRLVEKRGWTIEEHKDADGQGAGKEDF